MNSRSKSLGSHIYVDNHTLWLVGQAGEAVSHAQGHHLCRRQRLLPADGCVLATNLVGTCYDLWKLALLLVLSFDYRFDDGRVVGTKVDEDMRDACL